MATSNDSNDGSIINDLLQERPINWSLIQGRATTNRDSFPKDFIAQIVRAASKGNRRALPFDLFEWFLLQFGESAGYYGYGITKEKADQSVRIQNKRWVLDRNLQHLFAYYFSRCESLESARLFWSAFKHPWWVQLDAVKFIFGPIDDNTDARDLSATKMNNHNDVWECFVFLLRELAADCPWARNKQGDFLVGHAFFYMLFTQDISCVRLYEQHPVDLFMRCLSFMHQNNRNVLLEQNDGGNTVLHIVVSKFVTQIHESVWKHEYFDKDCCVRPMVELILNLTPESGRTRNMEGYLPLHMALQEEYHDVLDLFQAACPNVVDCRCLETGLYPFQMVSIGVKFPRACACQLCCGVGPYAGDKTIWRLTSAYLSLRHSPHLLLSAITGRRKKKRRRQGNRKQLPKKG